MSFFCFYKNERDFNDGKDECIFNVSAFGLRSRSIEESLRPGALAIYLDDE
jgi:hypothetical protein